MDKTLADLVAGDEVGMFRDLRGLPSIEKVSRTTATQIIIGDERYMRSRGYLIGNHSYRCRIEPANDDVRQRIAKSREAEILRRRIVSATEKLYRFRVDASNIARVEAFLIDVLDTGKKAD